MPATDQGHQSGAGDRRGGANGNGTGNGTGTGNGDGAGNGNGAGNGHGPQPAREADRSVMAVDVEQPPRLPFTVVGIGASAGGVEAFVEFFDALPDDTGMAFVLVQHLPPQRESLMADILSKHTRMPVQQVADGMAVRPNQVYVIRPGHTLTIRDGHLHLGEPLEARGHQRPVDDFFRSLAEEQRERAVCVILSGMGSNGTAGAQMVKAVGGVCVAQDPDQAKFPSMPRTLIDAGMADYVLRAREMPELLTRFAGSPYTRDAGRPADALARGDQKHLSDLLAILRTRTRHDFSGYKRPTLIRRVQRRMGLNQVGHLGEYVRLLRQTPAEASGLVDDLLIHVTGFFRDPDAWVALQEQTIAPLVAAKADGAVVRFWVTACSSGEEAYTLGMLLLEAAEAAGKRFDVKIFATDMAERALAHARAGIYPGGIESEITPERLHRFFEPDDSSYRVRRALREVVVFAPQNVLNDPPFSRMDVCSCRNLLIYLEPDVQRRVLSLLHFALVDGGTLFLGTSETVGGADELFETVDKRARIFRRVGPTRHGQLDFPTPTGSALSSLVNASGVPRTTDADRAEPRVARASVAQLTQRALVERYTPPSVVVDRQFRIVYFHGQTEPFLDQPRGEPTRDLLALARESVRGPIRLALHAAIERQEPQAARDGVVQTEAGPKRVTVRAAPLDVGPGTRYYLVSFEETPEVPAAPARPGSKGGDRRLREELARTREDLQSTIGVLQATNEEMKAANEEVTSVNEELQSTNEELETSKEELQSLNEELTTVNAQLQNKMEEAQATSNDLTSLLSSTDIAVIFLDPQFRVRRFTPAVKDLVDLIATDVGRPLRDMALKFRDPDLSADGAVVLAKLAPVEREVASDAGRAYTRRVTAYRTPDDRIDGVVVTFVDVTDQRRADATVREGEARYRALVNASSHTVYRMSPDWTEMRTLDSSGFLPSVTEPTRTWLEAFIPAGDQPRVLAAIRVAIGAKGVFQLEHRVRQADGSVGWTFSRAVPVLDAHGSVAEWFGAASDVTDRRRAAEALGESERRLRTVTDLVPDLLWHTSVDGDADWYNARWDEYTGSPVSRAAGRGWLDAVHPDDRGRAATTFDASIRDGHPLREEHRIRRADGQYRWFLVQAMPSRSADGTILEWYGAATDVHEQRQMMQAVQEQAERIRLAVQATRMGFWEWLVADDVIRSEPQNNRIMGVPADVAEGPFTAYARHVHPDDRDRVAGAMAAAAGSRADIHLEFRVVHPDRSVRWVAKYGHPIFATPDAPRAERVLGTALDVTDRREAELERDDRLAAERVARRSAEAANEAKDQFLANVSHELRTPLSAILLWAKMLRANPATADAQRREGLEVIERSANAQRELIEDLLDTSRIVSGKLRLDVRHFPMATLVHAATDGVRPAADGKRVAINAQVDPAVGAVNADPDRIRQVLWNLLTNAVKFTPAGGRVEVAVRRDGDDVEVRVTDTGRGIPAPQLPHVFDRFWQAESAARQNRGLGLGLAIAKQLVELHGGTIDAESGGPGTGATFRVRLPLPPSTQPARPAPGRSAREPELTGVRVLLVEDDAPTRDALAMVLRAAGADVTPVGTSADALAAYDAGPPDLILSDIGLPDEDGNELIRRIRTAEADRKAPATPAVALTALVRRQDRRRSAESGFQQHLAKPVDPDRLVRTLWSLLER